jgi:alkylation response protein AidB-like acyl-CoA dehydrogenase
VNFDIDEDQQLLEDSVRRFLRKDYSFDARREIMRSPSGVSERVWTTFAEMGLLALPIPESYGGFGAGAVKLMGIMECIGEELVVEPYLSTVGLGAQFVSRWGSEPQKKDILPAIAQARLKMAFAQTEDGARYDLAHVGAVVKKSAGGWIISGEKRVVIDAAVSGKMIVSARTSGNTRDATGISLFVVNTPAPGIRLKRYATLDGLRAADVTFDNVSVNADALIGEEGAALSMIQEVVDFATALVCAEAVGAIRSANEATLAYIKNRKQFGVPIGSFQVLQHRMVDMVMAYEQVKSMACLACVHADTTADATERARVISAAKIRVADACRQVSQDAIQLHGGMGLSDEMKISHTFRRLTMIARQFGDADHHLERFAA